MTSPLVNPVSGYSTLSRFDSLSFWPSISTSWGGAATIEGSGRLLGLRGLLGGGLLLRRCLLGCGLLLGRGLLGRLGGDLARVGAGRRVTATSGLGVGHRLLQGGHQVDHLAGLRVLRRRHHVVLAGGLALDEV